MTLSEAVKARTLRLTRPEWNEYAHIEIDPIGYGHYGPWVTLRDVDPIDPEQRVPVMQVQGKGWEPWEPPDDVARFIPTWPTYQPAEKGEAR